MTKAPTNNRSRRKKQDGRPKGTVKRYQFEETKLGFFLKYEVPAVYDIIMDMTQPGAFKEPPYLLIVTICKHTGDESLKKPKFIRYLELYKRDGLYCKRSKKLTPERKAYYESIRKRKLERYIERNKERITESIKKELKL